MSHDDQPRPAAGEAPANARRRPRRPVSCALAAAALLAALPASAVGPPELPAELAAKAFRHPDLDVRSEPVPAAALGEETAALAAALGAPLDSARIDRATGRWAAILPALPLIPGAGNDLTWRDLGRQRFHLGPPRDGGGMGYRAWGELAVWIGRHAAALGIDPAELAEPSIGASSRGALIQLSAGRTIGGVPVRDCALTAVVGHGNLILFGTRNWGDAPAPAIPALRAEQAEDAAARWLGGLAAGGRWRAPLLTWVPVALRGDGPAGPGLGYRLVWAVAPTLRVAHPGAWEALVDAATGEVLAFADTAHRLAAGGAAAGAPPGAPAVRQVIGGHLPRTNDGVPPGGVEDAGAPVPYADLEHDGVVRFADGGGNLLQCLEGPVTTNLDGMLVRIEDLCGPVFESTSGALLDLGTNSGTDCVVPPGGSAGNTRAARTSYYEVTRMKEIARGQLPANSWLGGQLTVQTNQQFACGAIFTGGVIRTSRASAGGPGCTNTGEIASVLDHEWGHGMDLNGTAAGVSNPSEGIADVYAALRHHDSCIARGLLPGPCGGYGDPCSTCTGVRDVDWAEHASGLPHDLDWVEANCIAPGSAPCGGGVHCEGVVYAEALWDLYKRDLQGFGGSAFDFDDDTAGEIATRLTFLAADLVGGWFDCVTNSAGCAADTGYMNALAADDDDGNLANGTPHMSAIFAAFDRHGIACPTPAVQDSGCAGTPSAAPVVAAAPLDRGVHLTWDPVAGASGYEVFRAEGVFGCDVAKVRLGATDATEWMDDGLQNGRTYRYVVIPKGPAPSCFGPGSACTPATPAPGAHVVAGAQPELIVLHGDGDGFVDNCESTLVTVDIENVGTGAQTGVEIVAVSSPSHPGTVVVDPLPIPVPGSIGECAPATASFEIVPGGLMSGGSLVLEVTVESDQMPFASVRTLSIGPTEMDPGAPPVPDTQSDVCPIFADGFEAGSVSRWSAAVP